MATHLRWTLAAAAVAGVAAVSAHQTGALWSDSAGAAGATIHSGRLDIAVGDSGAQAETYQFSDLAMADMVSGDFVQRPLHVSNAGDVPMRYRIDSATLGGELPLQLAVTAMSSEAACPASEDAAGDLLYSGALPDAATVDRDLAPGESEVLCFRVTMGQNPPTSTETRATFTFLGTQA